jgi:hypothetical protein
MNLPFQHISLLCNGCLLLFKEVHSKSLIDTGLSLLIFPIKIDVEEEYIAPIFRVEE